VRSIDWEDGRAVRIDADGPGGVARLEARWAVAAGGAHMGRRLALARGRTLHALVFRTPDLVHDRRAIELIFDETIYPHYGWVFPEPGGGCNVGICVEDSRRRGRPIGALLEEFLERRLAGRWRGARRRNGLRGHPILASAFPRVATPPGVLPAGEAACLVNPVTGEGIGPALRSGVAAARAVAREVGGAATRERAAAGYRAELARCVAPSLVVGEALRLAGVRSLDWIFANRRWLFGGRRILRLALHL
jgi:flavin-dependent dehydrogenase